MSEPDPFPIAPAPWTLGYHLRFVPALIRARLGPQPQATGFASHAGMMVPIAIVIALVLFSIGLPGMVEGGFDPVSALLTLLGGGGLLAIIGMSIADAWHEPRSYQRFEPAVFFFLLLLGISIGLFIVRLDREGLGTAAYATILSGSTLAGYAAGLLLGYWWQALGIFGRFLSVLMYPMLIGLLVTDLVIMSG